MRADDVSPIVVAIGLAANYFGINYADLVASPVIWYHEFTYMVLKMA